MMLVIVLKLIMIGGIVLFCALGIKKIAELNEEIKETKRAYEERRKRMLSILESVRNHEDGADIPRKIGVIPEKGVFVFGNGVVQSKPEFEKWDVPSGRIIQLAFYAKKKRVRKKNLKRMGEYGRNQKRQISGNR